MHHRLTPIEARALGRALKITACSGWKIRRRRESGMFSSDSSAYRDADCGGEVFNSIWDCKQLIEEQLIDIFARRLPMQAALPGCDGLPICIALSGTYRFAWPFRFIACCHAAALHFDLWVPNFGVQE